MQCEASFVLWGSEGRLGVVWADWKQGEVSIGSEQMKFEVNVDVNILISSPHGLIASNPEPTRRQDLLFKLIIGIFNKWYLVNYYFERNRAGSKKIFLLDSTHMINLLGATKLQRLVTAGKLQIYKTTINIQICRFKLSDNFSHFL